MTTQNAKTVVVMRTTRTKLEVVYEVEVDGTVTWSKSVRFGLQRAQRAGGACFRRAAEEQAERAARAGTDLRP